MKSASLRHCASGRLWRSLRCSHRSLAGPLLPPSAQCAGQVARRFTSSQGNKRDPQGISSPRVPRSAAPEPSPSKDASAGDLPPIIDRPLPPRPAFYVPPEERDPSDESLAFLKPGSPLQHLVRRQDDPQLPDGLDPAPYLAERAKAPPTYMDADAARVQSTSVHAGQPLLHRRAVVDTSSYYYSPPVEEVQERGADGRRSAEVLQRSRLHTVSGEAVDVPTDAVPLQSPRASAALGYGGSSTSKERSIFAASQEFAPVDKTLEEAEDEKERAAPKPAVKQLEADIKKLEYYYGTPQYEKLLVEFRKKYGEDDAAKSGSAGAASPAADRRVYSAAEVEQGLEEQPVDFLRGSPKLQAQLLSGPRAYDPVTIMQQQGVMRFQGYAFPPTVELGKLKGDGQGLKALHDAHKSHPLVARVRQSFNALVGRQDARDDYVAAADKPKEDTHLLYRTLGLDAVQRRQMRYMLTDFDHADRHTTFHVMMSYPYTDWLHVFYMVFVGWCLYQLQVRYGAYEFYDEYMGLDLRQAPRLQKPVLAGVTVVVMVFLLFQPLLVASIATTRAYRIVMRRPIGPP